MKRAAEPAPRIEMTWSPETVHQVQPVISALFHEVMNGLTPFKSRVFAIRRDLGKLAERHAADDETKECVRRVMAYLDVLDAFSVRLHRAMTVPRDAVWAGVIEDRPVRADKIVEGISEALGPTREVPPAPAGPKASGEA